MQRKTENKRLCLEFTSGQIIVVNKNPEKKVEGLIPRPEAFLCGVYMFSEELKSEEYEMEVMLLHACKWLLVVSKSQTEKTKEKKKRENRLTIATLPPRTLTLLTSALRHSGQSQFPSKHSPHTLSVFINLPLERRADNLEPHLCHLVNLTARGRGSELLQVRVHLSGPPAYQSRVYLKSTRSDGQQQTEGHTHTRAQTHTHARKHRRPIQRSSDQLVSERPSCCNVSFVALNPGDNDSVFSGILYGEQSSAPLERRREAVQLLQLNVHVYIITLHKQSNADRRENIRASSDPKGI